eukprot:5929783-Pleurochrysis_carterae.AAC.2
MPKQKPVIDSMIKADQASFESLRAACGRGRSPPWASAACLRIHAAVVAASPPPQRGARA